MYQKFNEWCFLSCYGYLNWKGLAVKLTLNFTFISNFIIPHLPSFFPSSLLFCPPIQPSDLCSPNLVFMLLFCYHLYHHLPAFRPASKSTITLEGTLHSTVAHQVGMHKPQTQPPLSLILRPFQSLPFDHFSMYWNLWEGLGTQHFDEVHVRISTWVQSHKRSWPNLFNRTAQDLKFGI